MGRKPSIYVEVLGTPVPQGSMRMFTNKAGQSYLTHASSRLQEWRKVVAAAIREAAKGKTLAGPLYVDAVFVLPRGKTVKRERPTCKPDLDKLVRAVLDALTASQTITDDAQVVRMQAIKQYGDKPRLILYAAEMEVL